MVGHQRAALGEPQTTHRAVVLNGDRYASERTLVAWLDRLGCSQRPLPIDLDERVQGGVELLDPCERGFHELPCRDLS